MITYLKKALPLFALAAALCLSSCANLYSKRIEYKRHPISVRVINKYIDEDSPIEYTLAFRNIGREVMTFDYTVSDEPNVPHVDKDGPNSGLIENLYPGAEVEIANPTKKKTVWVTLGVVSYGKKTKEEITKIYSPDAPVAAGAEAGAEAPLF